MTRRSKTPDPDRLSTLIAGVAARLMAEEGLGDYAQAKRKAARQLGLPENSPLPETAAVEAQLRLHQRLYQAEEHAGRLRSLRIKAAEIMTRLEAFNPYLSGAVADGTAGRFAEIDIQLFTDGAKDVEIFLLNQGIEFAHSVPRSERAEAVLTLDDALAPINLIVYRRDEERVTVRGRDGRPRPRFRLDAVRAQLASDEDTAP